MKLNIIIWGTLNYLLNIVLLEQIFERIHGFIELLNYGTIWLSLYVNQVQLAFL